MTLPPMARRTRLARAQVALMRAQKARSATAAEVATREAAQEEAAAVRTERYGLRRWGYFGQVEVEVAAACWLGRWHSCIRRCRRRQVVVLSVSAWAWPRIEAPHHFWAGRLSQPTKIRSTTDYTLEQR